MSMRDGWLAQLPVIAALIYNVQEEPDVDQAVDEALEILESCEDAVNPTKDRSKRRER